MKGARRYDQYTSLGGGAGGRRPGLRQKVHPGLRVAERSSVGIRRQLSYGAAAAGPAHPEDTPQRDDGGGPLRVPGEAAGGGRQTGL